MGFDEVILHLGEFGRYQKRIYFLICLPAISCAFHKLANVFIQAIPDHRCLLPDEHLNASYNLPMEILNASYPFDDKLNKWSTCTYFDGINRTIAVCDQYVYDTSKYASSAVSEWDMVCSKAWLRASADAIFMIGVLLGSIIYGHLSDKYGRKPIFFLSLVMQLIFGITAAISPEYITYSISRLIVGATTSGVFLVAYVIAMEMVGQTYRMFAGVACMMFFSLGYMLTAAFAYFITDWRYLQIALTLPGVLFMTYHWFIPESARWLLSKNRNEEAVMIIQKAAKENNVTIPKEVIDDLLKSEPVEVGKETKRGPSVLDLFKYPNLRKKTLLILFDWFVNSGTYYGLSWNTSNLGGNELLNFVIFGAVEIPAYTFLLFTLNRWGRRTILCSCMLVSGTMLLLTMAVPNDMDWMIVVLAMIGKLAITSSYGTVYIFSAEQFPTVVRNVGLGAASMVARFGGILAPYFNLLSEIWKPFPLIIFGFMAFIAGLLSLLLPETHNRKLPETIEDGERFDHLEKDKDVQGEEMETLTKPKDIHHNKDSKEDV